MTQTSPWDLFRAKGASPRVKLFSPGRRTCEMDRPGRGIILGVEPAEMALLSNMRKVNQTSVYTHRIKDLCKASGLVITMEPLGFVLTKQVDDFLMRVL